MWCFIYQVHQCEYSSVYGHVWCSLIIEGTVNSGILKPIVVMEVLLGLMYTFIMYSHTYLTLCYFTWKNYCNIQKNNLKLFVNNTLAITLHWEYFAERMLVM